MKRRVYSAAILLALIGVVAAWAAVRSASNAVAASGQSRPEHEHAGKGSSPPGAELEDLFAGDEHAGHGHADGDGAGRPDAHAGHGHAEEADAHAGHGHAEEADAHAGHGHGDHGGDGEFCPEHRLPEAVDALCHGDHIGELQPGEGMQVRLAAADLAAKTGIQVSRPHTVALAGGTPLPGRAEFNRNRLAHIAPLAPGVMRKVAVQPGARIGSGALLAEVAMPETASLKGQLLAARAREAQAEAAYLREKALLERGVSSRQEFQQAEAEQRAARSASEQYRQQLRNFGLLPADIELLLRSGDSSAVTPLRAPFAGTVVAVQAAVGEAVEPGTPLFTLADLDLLWVEVSLPESRIYQARVDAPVQAEFDGLPGVTFSGRLFQVGAALDERSRTLKALAEVKNPGHRLKVGMFGKVRLLEGDEAQALAVPAEALQSIDGLSFVFVQREPDLFELRRVQAGPKQDGVVPILAGLSPDEQVVSSQGFALKSEVLKARLGASCADH